MQKLLFKIIQFVFKTPGLELSKHDGTLQSSLKIVATIIMAITKAPAFFFAFVPDGWKTATYAFITGLLAILQGTDTVQVVDYLCGIVEFVVHFWNKEYICDYSTGASTIQVWAANLLIAIRAETRTGIFKSEVFNLSKE